MMIFHMFLNIEDEKDLTNDQLTFYKDIKLKELQDLMVIFAIFKYFVMSIE